MIAYLYGTVAEIGEGYIILDVNGIGYELKVTGQTCEMLSGEVDKVKLHTYMHVKEDDVQLFGFLSKDDLQVFKLLITVNGIGPKGALGILSALTPDDLRFAVASGDVKAISRAPGIGAKTAQRVILDLKDKLKLSDAFEHFTNDTSAVLAAMGDGAASAKSEAIQALIALGYSNTDAVRAVKKAGDTTGMDVEDILKLALKQMSLF